LRFSAAWRTLSGTPRSVFFRARSDTHISAGSR
jgi:hypothetical protein